MKPLLNQLKVPFLVVFLTLVMIYLFSSLFGPLPLSVKNSQSDVFTVNGTGEEKAVPDSSQFSVGVTKTAPTVEAATNLVNTSTNEIIAQLKALGIEEKDIKTQNFASYPNYSATPALPLRSSGATSMSMSSDEPETATIAIGDNASGYTVSQDLMVTTKSVDLANKALDAAIASGANQISGVSFTINDDDRKKLVQKARKAAIADAKSQAQEIAKDAGFRLGRVVNIYVSDAPGMPVMMYDQKARGSAMEVAAPTNLQPGENTVTVSVTLSYETL